MKCAVCGRSLKRAAATLGDGRPVGPRCAKMAATMAVDISRLPLLAPNREETELHAWLDARGEHPQEQSMQESEDAWKCPIPEEVLERARAESIAVHRAARPPWWKRAWEWIKWRVTVYGGFG